MINLFKSIKSKYLNTEYSKNLKKREKMILLEIANKAVYDALVLRFENAVTK
jgi:hypothetical protein